MNTIRRWTIFVVAGSAVVDTVVNTVVVRPVGSHCVVAKTMEASTA